MEIIIKTFSFVIIGLVKSYQYAVSPFFVSSCRHTPTCSEYSIDAIKQFGPIKGIYLAAKRIFRCRPFGSSGYDPVPTKDEKQ